jgi:hypothetical protein
MIPRRTETSNTGIFCIESATSILILSERDRDPSHCDFNLVIYRLYKYQPHQIILVVKIGVGIVKMDLRGIDLQARLDQPRI